MLRRMLVFLGLCVFLTLWGQEDARLIMEKIRENKNDSYRYGEGRGEDLETARQKALGDLLSKLSTTFDYQNSVSESQHNDNYKLDQTSVLSSRWRGKLEDIHTLEYKEENKESAEWVCMKYVSVRSLENSEAKRFGLVRELVSKSKEYETSLELTEALKHLVWALNILTYYGEHPVFLKTGKHEVSIVGIRGDINRIFSKVRINVTEVKKEICNGKENYQVVLQADYAGLTPASMQLTYFNGSTMGGPIIFHNGIATMTLSHYPYHGKLSVKVVYDSRKEANVLGDMFEPIYESGCNNRFEAVCSRELDLKDMIVKKSVKHQKSQIEKKKPAITPEGLENVVKKKTTNLLR